MTEAVRPWIQLAQSGDGHLRDEAVRAILRIYGGLIAREAGRCKLSYVGRDEAKAAAEEGIYEGIVSYDLATPLAHPGELTYHMAKYARRAVRNAVRRCESWYRHIDKFEETPEERPEKAAASAEETWLASSTESLQTALEGLTEHEAAIVKARTIEGRTCREIAKDLGISHQAVSEAYGKAIWKIKQYMTD